MYLLKIFVWSKWDLEEQFAKKVEMLLRVKYLWITIDGKIIVKDNYLSVLVSPWNGLELFNIHSVVDHVDLALVNHVFHYGYPNIRHKSQNFTRKIIVSSTNKKVYWYKYNNTWYK